MLALCQISATCKVEIKDLVCCSCTEMIFITNLAECFTTTSILWSLHHIGNNCWFSSGKRSWMWYLTKYVWAKPAWRMNYTGLSRCLSPLAHTKDLREIPCGSLRLLCMPGFFSMVEYSTFNIQPSIFNYSTWYWPLKALYQSRWPECAPGCEGLEPSQIYPFKHSLTVLTLSICLNHALTLVSCILLSSADHSQFDI